MYWMAGQKLPKTLVNLRYFVELIACRWGLIKFLTGGTNLHDHETLTYGLVFATCKVCEVHSAISIFHEPFHPFPFISL